MVQKIPLEPHDTFGYPVQGLLPLVDAANEPQGVIQVLLNITLHRVRQFIGTSQGFQVKRVDPQLGQAVIVQPDDVVVPHLFHVDVGADDRLDRRA